MEIETSKKLELLNENSSLETSSNTNGIISKKNIKKGDVLLSSVPFAFVLKSSLRGLHCDTCFRRRQSAQRCSGCATAYYCHRDCQKASWDIHKKECSKIKKLKPNLPPDTARLMARVIFRLQEGGGDFEENIDEKKSRKFNDLMNHCDDIKEDALRQEHFTSLLVVLNRYLGEENLPSTSELLGIYGRILVNSFTITDKDLKGVGIGVYLAASIVDHSCKPNAYACFIGPKVIIRSLYEQPELDLSKVRISYIDVLNTTEIRRKELQEGYFFTCDCGTCSDEKRERIMSSILCGNSDCVYPIWVSEVEDEVTPMGQCPNCGFDGFDTNIRQRYNSVLEITRTKMEEKRDKNYMETCKLLLEKQESFFHKLNVWKVKVLDAAFEASIAANSWESAVSYGCENLHGIRYYYGPNHPMYGLYFLKLAKIELFLFKLQEALNHVERAEPILRISHGKEHPLYSEDLAPLLKQARQEVKMMRNSGFSLTKRTPETQYKSISP